MIRVGPAGWAYKDWEAIVYPQSANRGVSTRWPTSAPNPRSDRDTRSPRANHPFGADPPSSACPRSPAFCSHKLATNAARPTAGQSRRERRAGGRRCEDLQGIGLDLPAVVVQDHQQTDSWLATRTSRTETGAERCASSDTVSPLNLKYSDSTAEKVPVLLDRLCLPPTAVRARLEIQLL